MQFIVFQFCAYFLILVRDWQWRMGYLLPIRSFGGLLMHPSSFLGQRGPLWAGMHLQEFLMYTSFAAVRHSLMNFGQRLYVLTLSNATSVYWCLDLNSLQDLPPLQVLLGGRGRIFKWIYEYSHGLHISMTRLLTCYSSKWPECFHFGCSSGYCSFSCLRDGQSRTWATEVTWISQTVFMLYGEAALSV